MCKERPITFGGEQQDSTTKKELWLSVHGKDLFKAILIRKLRQGSTFIYICQLRNSHEIQRVSIEN